MRRKDKEYKDTEDVIRRSKVCRLAISDNNQPYIIPLCFGYKNNTLFFHSASKGRKLDILRENSHVCFEFDVDLDIIENDKACDWSMKYKSVIGIGKANFLDDKEAKRKALDIIMKQYSDKDFEYTDKSLENTVVIRVDIASITGKQSGY